MNFRMFLVGIPIMFSFWLMVVYDKLYLLAWDIAAASILGLAAITVAAMRIEIFGFSLSLNDEYIPILFFVTFLSTFWLSTVAHTWDVYSQMGSPFSVLLPAVLSTMYVLGVGTWIIRGG